MIIRAFWVIVRSVQDILFLLRRNKILVYSCMEVEKNHYISKNWGDDINFYLIEEISNLHVKVINVSKILPYLHLKAYSCIGSIIGTYQDEKMEIWGSGMLDSNIVLKIKPNVIHSVRGPLSRNCLVNQGISCPSLYGDPALLISRYYRPIIERKYEMGIVLHYCDNKSEIVKKISEKHKDVLVIKMTDYINWREIPDKICSCKKIVSSSLHGIIVSDSYGIPNIWIKLSESLIGGSFKFVDYYLSVNRKKPSPIEISSEDELFSLKDSNDFECANQIDFNGIFNSCPFKSSLHKFRYND